jgi:integrase
MGFTAMSRRPNPVPTYRLHKPSGRAVTTVRLPDGSRKDVYLGAYDSPESRAEYARILQEAAASPLPGPLHGPGASSTLSVNELLLAFWKHAEQHYRTPDGTLTSEIHNFRLAVRVTRDLYGHTPVRDFGPLALKAIRNRLVASGLSRRVVNGRVARVRHVFKWGMGEQLVPPAVYTALTAVTGLQRGRTSAPDPKPVGPVSEDLVRAVLPFVRPQIAAMIRVQLLTGMRPAEVCRMRPVDIDQTGPVWYYLPPHHKTAHRGKVRTVAIGPQAQALLAEFTPPETSDFYFSPRQAVEEQLAERSAGRKTPRWASHMRRNEEKRAVARARPAGRCYQPHSYAVAVSRACERAFPLPPRLAPFARQPGESPASWRERVSAQQRAAVESWRNEHHWHPNQLRHTCATLVRTRFGLEAAQVLLNHARADVTQIYAEKNLALAALVATEMG